MSLNLSPFDPAFDTQKIYVSVTTKFKMREDLKRKDKLCPVYLFITGDKMRERIILKIFISAKNWDDKKQSTYYPNNTS